MESEQKKKIIVTEKSPGLNEDIISESMSELSKRLRTRRTIRNITSGVAIAVSLAVLIKEFFEADHD